VVSRPPVPVVHLEPKRESSTAGPSPRVVGDALKILVVSGLFPRENDPMRGIFIHRQIRALRDLGVDARVLCPITISRPAQGWSEWDGVPVRYCASWHGPIARYFANWQVPIALAPALHGRRLLRALQGALGHEGHRPDLYHAHWLFPTAWATIRAVADSDVPVVASARGSDVHTYPVRNRRLRRLTREAMGAATLVSAVSRALALQARALGPPGMEIEVVHNGVDDRLFCPSSDRRALRRDLGLPEEGLYWISVCRLHPAKGTAELLGAFTRLAEKSAHVRLLLVGDGPEAASLQRKLMERGLADRVVLAGRRAPEEVARWLQAADAFVLASHAEGLPNVVLEAMASGLPVVATDVGGTNEAVVHGVSGLLVPHREVGALAEAMARVSEDHELAARFGAEARKRVERNFGWRASALRWIDVYEKALRLTRPRAS
jgi:teichuronic acid biosynthesis glycosyltransferase TuaC